MSNLTVAQTDRVIQMAWEDRTTFEAIREQFGLEPGQVIKLMRNHFETSPFGFGGRRTNGSQHETPIETSFEVGQVSLQEPTWLISLKRFGRETELERGRGGNARRIRPA